MARWRAGLGDDFGGGATEARIPSGLSSMPFVWDYLGTPLPMRFLGGFVGVGQDEGTLVVRSVIGWAVRDDPPRRPVPESFALSAGRVTNTQELTLAEVEELIATVEAMGEAVGVSLTCAPAGDLAEAGEDPQAKIRCFFAVGVRACTSDSAGAEVADLHAALEVARGLPRLVWHGIERRIFGRMTEEDALHLVAAGVRSGGELRFGGEDEAHSFGVARVSADGGAWAVVDVSPRAHAARVRSTGERGVESSAGRYVLVGREG